MLFIRWVLNKQKWTKQITKKYFNKRLIMTCEDEEIYNNSHICKEELNGNVYVKKNGYVKKN